LKDLKNDLEDMEKKLKEKLKEKGESELLDRMEADAKREAEIEK